MVNSEKREIFRKKNFSRFPQRAATERKAAPHKSAIELQTYKSELTVNEVRCGAALSAVRTR